MPRPSDDALLALFGIDAPSRFARLAAPELADRVPGVFRAAACSIARQAAGGWTLRVYDREGFHLAGAHRELLLSTSFAKQCGRVADMVIGSRAPALSAAVAALGGEEAACAAIMSAFFHYFAAHEFIHVEQGLGSEQYADSDFYMPVVMEADYVADVAGLVVTLSADVPELRPLTPFARTVLLVAIHIASMHSFSDPDATDMDFFAFSRLALWHLHFARIAKAGAQPRFDSPAFERSWIVTFPKLVGRGDQTIGSALLDERVAEPLPARSDVVVAYHGDDGLFRIHRTVLTDAERTRRLCQAVLEGRFDDVTSEYEELLVNNPALVPGSGARSSAVEWAAGAVIDGLDRLRAELAQVGGATEDAVEEVRDDLARLLSVVRGAGRWTAEIDKLAADADGSMGELAAMVAGERPAQGMPALRRRALSAVDQIAVAASGDPAQPSR